jgi:DNA-binding NarL/FixJ family response regulator
MASQAARPDQVPGHNGGPLRVLVAEDDTALRFALTELVDSQPELELVAAVADGWSATEVAARESPDVAIVDVRMPGGGAWTTREIRRLSPNTQVVVFSGSSDPVTEDRMREAGAGGYLVKGSSVSAILETIQEAVGPPRITNGPEPDIRAAPGPRTPPQGG